MMRTAWALIVGLLIVTGEVAPAAAQGSCSGFRTGCVGACTPDRIARYYAGSLRRCTASCEPRFQQCIRSGAWADLEYLRSGGWEPASIF